MSFIHTLKTSTRMPSLPLSSSSSTTRRWRRFPLLVVPDHKNIHIQTSTEEEEEEDGDDDDSVTTTSSNNNRRRSLYCVLLKQPLQFQIELPSQFDKTHRFCGSSHGWLITSVVDDQDILHISLFNPFSPNPNNNLINDLPPITENLDELPYAREDFGKKTLDLYHNHYVVKAVLSCDPDSNPPDDEEYVVMVIYSPYRRLAFIRPRIDTTWTYLDRNIYEKPVADVIYYKRKVFSVDWFGMVVCCEAGINNWNWRTRMVSNLQTILSPSDKKYLVESVDGELLLVQRCFDYKDEPEPHNAAAAAEATVTEFQVFKMMKDIDDDDYSDCDNSNCDQWIEIKSIGDCALFVGDNGSTSIRASDIGECSSNSIYFTADGFEYTMPSCDPFGYTDMGVFHLEDKSIELIDYTTPAMSSQTPIWITTVKDELN